MAADSTMSLFISITGKIMNRRQRLINILKGMPTDRPAVNFYEIGGLVVDPDDQNEFNIFNSPSWRPL